ncbi:hypothetical protein [Terriglobus tenax]|uniref:hypothetical protein n=1 Tax=Terriglobus tenax TaxID=1111115 RepID=UPI0021DF6D49|nr:hypothetical protein [Terriglobus tenax]
MVRLLAFGSLLAFALSPCLAQDVTGAQDSGPASPNVAAPREPKTLSNDAVIRMTKAGLDADIIAQTVRTQPGIYTTGPDDLIALKEAGVSQQVISAMMAKSSGIFTHVEKPPVETAPLSSQVDDIGIYYKMRETRDWEPMPIELVNFRQGGALKSTLTNGIIKKDMNGHVKGTSSRLNLRAGDKVLLYVPSGTSPEEYIFVRFRQHSDNREFRTETGNVFHTQTGADRDAVPFHPEKIGKNMYSFELEENIGPGEYGILPPGNVNARGMANAGKIYTFAIGK